MTYKVSTGLRNKMLDTGSMKSVMNLGFIDIYSGPVPPTADAAPDVTCVKLCRVSNASGATGLTLDPGGASAGVIAKNPGETWSGVNLASGTASFYRHVAPGDDATASTTQPRVQGAIALAGAEMNLTNPALTSGATQTVDYYVVSLPTL